MGRYSKTFFIIDALDECSEDAQRTLLELGALQVKMNLNLIITSRPSASIKQVLEGAEQLEVRARDEDVRSYLQERISTTRVARVVGSDAALQENILNTITEKADGMYVCSTCIGLTDNDDILTLAPGSC